MCKNLSFEECELAILRTAVDSSEKREGLKLISSPITQQIISMVENFISKKKCIVYGGTAINNILPEKDQFYDYDYEIPDYDFFATEPMKLATELADLFAKKGFQDVEAKSGVHHGTYKVFVNMMGVADITYLHPELYNVLLKKAIKKKNILYAPANFLRQAMYLELSRPMGDVSRWEKVLKRLNALNKNYPLVSKKCLVQRKYTGDKETEIFNISKKILIQQNVVFIGGYANALYSNYTKRPKVQNIPDFDVLSVEPLKTATMLKDALVKAHFNAHVDEHEAIGELVSKHYSVSIDEDYIAFIYEPVACHSYNEIQDGPNKIKIGTIDTLLSYYLAFMYADRDYFDENRLLCLSSILFNVQQKNRLKQNGLLKRFSIQCYGVQKNLRMIREENQQLYKDLKKTSKEFKERFFKYAPKTRRKKLKNN